MAERKVKDKDIREQERIARYDPENNCFQMKDGSYMDLLKITSKDLTNANVDEIEMDCFTWAKFHMTYPLDVSVITLLFPCNTSEQQRFWTKKIEQNKNPAFAEWMRISRQELEYREKNSTTREFYLALYFINLEEKEESMRTVNATLGIGKDFLLQTIDAKKKEMLMFKMHNMNSQIF